MQNKNQLLLISTATQQMHCYENDQLVYTYSVSTAKNGLGEMRGSECTPRGWHTIHSIIGFEHEINSVFVGRKWTGEIYSEKLAEQYPGRDWILTRILRLDGLEDGRNKGGDMDSLQRFIYIHGTPDSTLLGQRGSRGCIRMRNLEIIELANWVSAGSYIYIE
ncbi:L,D-transpeptidase [Legionella israelensis]|uniref:L,D-transpeptidase n=1 Tax=Legionella israelensis TaxID=454 RepID=UPI00117CBF0E|nr:L,D-transpeptidase [Legionella israelensis]QDP72832.1 L,D-transpeptidase [Legionella israelensis]